ncbi:Ubiquitin C-terminal hydrolase 12 [Cardamine amara subsp. amara]|uniref:Ubiquitin C-terminal hydrolase 12 n=1 Tax=Cardamine amara subsp. amara TaxID=228776 RepID=A0ABD0ZSZ9_CARAN
MFPPSSYEIKMDSFKRLLNLTYAEKYVSRPFAVGGYNWTLIVYPKGNKDDGGLGYLSLYVAIDNSTLVTADQEVYAYLRFFIFNNKKGEYFTIQDIDASKFNAVNTMWGLSQVLSLDTFKDPINGYIYGGDCCRLGVDVIISSLYKESELFSIKENFPYPILTWTIPGFSTLSNFTYLSDVFSIGGRKWNVQVFPYGNGPGFDNSLSMYLNINADEIFRPYENIYVRAKLRVLNQLQLDNVERQIDVWFNGPGYGRATSWGYFQFISLSDLIDSSKGFIVNDVLIVQVEFLVISSTKYIP